MLKMIVLAVSLLAVAGLANAGMVIFSDSAQNGWSVTDWWVASTSTPGEFYAGTAGLKNTNPGGNQKVTVRNTAGYTVDASTNILEFYVNSPTAATKMFISINNGAVNLTQYFNIDGDVNTWEKQDIDLSSVTVPITRLEIDHYWNGTGSSAGMFIDEISLVPEPATLSLLGLGLLAIRRRRSA